MIQFQKLQLPGLANKHQVTSLMWTSDKSYLVQVCLIFYLANTTYTLVINIKLQKKYETYIFVSKL